MKKENLMQLIDVATGRKKADVVIKNCKIVNVYSASILEKDIALVDGLIAGLGDYEGEIEVDAGGAYALPGLIEGHIHVESAFVTPQEIGRLLVPCGTTTIIADPHEIVNVCGEVGFDYMVEAAKGTDLDIKYQVPSCVPATPFEHSGATITSKEIAGMLTKEEAFGLGELMNFPGVLFRDDEVMHKIMAAKNSNKVIDGHAPGISGNDVNAYIAAGIKTDHECSTVEEMLEKIDRGMYVQLRQGSACRDLEELIKGITPANSRRLVLCSDDRQPKDMLEKGDLDDLLRTCVKLGLDPITAIQMATLNPAECYGLSDRGAIAPGLRGDIILVDNLKDFAVQKVWIQGMLVAEHGHYLGKQESVSIDKVAGSVRVKDISMDKLNLKSASNKVKVIDIVPNAIVTKKGVAEVELTAEGDFVFDENQDIVKIVIVERHQMTGNVAVGLLRGYGMKQGAVAQTIAHDSHNIVAVGVSNEEIMAAIQAVIETSGGAVIVKENQVLASMPLPIGGLMSDQSGEWVGSKLEGMQQLLHNEFQVKEGVEPLMTLAFMSLPVIPELKITDMGLFDVTKFAFTAIEADKD
ncbi:MAG: adenine deaminase [Lachnospiraceae bacterium]|nr:adenine deaminase [Lachnospiraceae bacterium]